METPFRDALLEIWEDRVEGRQVFRGMSAKDLRDPLDPSCDPFESVRPTLLRFIDVLESLVAGGLQFTVREDHFGEAYAHDLRSILGWSRRDLSDPGIDFTSSYYDACGYADCYQGSQLKQNFKTITDELPGRKDDPVVKAGMSNEDWALVAEVNAWVSQESAAHRSVVLRIRRSCPAFDGYAKRQAVPPVGSFDSFCRNVQTALEDADLPATPSSIEKVLPKEEDGFAVRLNRPLSRTDIDDIDDVTWDRAVKAPGPRRVG